ncbi:protein Ycf2 [Xiphophorus hellerii]|uniref:protein Ycf2 n=1 Tax=Xiphophorus hellerii TaxID=8084 RepID=UPI0013B3D67F|nr:protein Ycf2-like [Xiphophorus hellerii]XP_032433024.1 protein Ycf2-like [Xiphophorus hellerii]XP_032433025.1 protein Ycf2-like [Xiphophorus hellerii]
MVMTCHNAPSTARLILLVLLIVTPQLASSAPAWGEQGEGGVQGRTRTDHKEDSLGPLLSPPQPQIFPGTDDALPDRVHGPGQDSQLDKVSDPEQVLAVLLESLDHPGDGEILASRNRDWEGEDQSQKPPSAEDVQGGEIRGAAQTEGERGKEEDNENQEADKAIEKVILGHLAADQGDEIQEKEKEDEEAKTTRSGEDQNATEEERNDKEDEQEEGNNLEQLIEKVKSASTSEAEDPSLERKIRGYFQNIDLGLQDNEILPPLKGYKAYNTQLAQAGKKQHWQDNMSRNRPVKGGNFMDDFNDGGEELEEEVEEEESLSHMQEEVRARAEKQEVLRQQEEAERAREEEQRLADIASDMLLQYMGRKQQSFMKPRQKSSNTAEDKRSEEVLPDEDDLDQQMIDRLIEISSKLHLPADDVIEIISDVEEKKKKRKELQQQPINSNPIIPRFRPLVPPPLASPPIYHYTASKNPKKAPYKHNKSNKKWHKDKVKSYKQDYWYKPQKQLDYWYKPQKQFLAFPSYPYYQKPYRAYYPVYFPYPKEQYYGKSSPSRDQPFGPQELDLQPPRRRHRGGGKNRAGQGWRQQPPPRLPLTPYISNYILPHPRTYQPLPPPKPVVAPRRGRRPQYYYPQVTPGDDYEEDGLVPQLDSEEELENFIERIYMKRRMY